MKVLSSYEDGRLTLYFKGELDHHEAAAALRRIGRAVDDYLPRECAVDMQGLTFMDSSGIALVLKISRLVAELGGRSLGQTLLTPTRIDRILQVTAAGK